MKTVSEDECLALWLDEWTQFLKFKRWKDTRDAEEEGMEPSSPEEVENFRQAILNLPRPYDSKELVPGDLRLLLHELVGDETDASVAILEAGNDEFLVAPMSLLGVPALPSELQIEAGVLNLWQSVWVSATTLRKSLLCENRLNEAELVDALEVLNAWVSRKQPAGNTAERVGARMSRYKSDPRHQYQEMQESLFSSLEGRPVTQASIVDPVTFPPLQRTEWLAAKDHHDKIARVKLKAPQDGVTIELKRTSETGSIALNVFDETGEFSKALHGYCIVSSSGERLVEIEQSGCASAKLPDGPIALMRPDGTLAALERVEV
jgi:hypothetical protein